MGQQAAGRGNYDVGAALQTLAFLLVAHAIIAAVNGYSVDIHIITKALQGLINLLRQFARGRHHQTVDGVCRMRFLLQKREQG